MKVLTQMLIFFALLTSPKKLPFVIKWGLTTYIVSNQAFEEFLNTFKYQLVDTF